MMHYGCVSSDCDKDIQSGIHIQRQDLALLKKKRNAILANEWIFICFKLNELFNFLKTEWCQTLEWQY